MSPHYLFKVILVGSAAVGKTSMVLRYTTGRFREYYAPTLGADFATRAVETSKGKVKLQIWDLGSQDFLGRVRAKYYRGARGVLFLYDVTNKDSFREIEAWWKEVTSNVEDTFNIIVANKTDRSDRIISTQEGEELASRYSAGYMETSVKSNEGVDDLFALMAKRIAEATI
ncbi:MAG: GTP-binding protein [Candidatus Thorarchaeota archaeon]|nr:GTP-binding protein [Candidatus Thorarchaeota archaeon]